MKLSSVFKSLSVALILWMSSLPTVAQDEPLQEMVYGAQVRVVQEVSGGFDSSRCVQAVLHLNRSLVSDMLGSRLADIRSVSYENLLPGDTVFFSSNVPGASHHGFYLGDGEFIHASSGGMRVMISQMKFGYYRQRFEGGGRPASLQLAG